MSFLAPFLNFNLRKLYYTIILFVNNYSDICKHLLVFIAFNKKKKFPGFLGFLTFANIGESLQSKDESLILLIGCKLWIEDKTYSVQEYKKPLTL